MAKARQGRRHMHGNGRFARAAFFVTDDDYMRHTAVPSRLPFKAGYC
jgi:hypothetical protein